MFITSLYVTNWKCWKETRKFNFDRLEIINKPNGTGKTSLFEAISFGIWGKPPAGFNLNTVRNDENKTCKVEIFFELQNDNIHIIRSFPSPTIAELYVNNNLICESVRTIEKWINERLNYNLVNQLWTNDLIHSQITDPNFFIKTVLEDKLKDPIALQIEFKSRIYQTNRNINKINIDTNLPNKKDTEDKIKDLEIKLKDGTIDSSLLSSARLAQKASEINDDVELSSKEISEIINNTNKIYRIGNIEKLKENLKIELNKCESKWGLYSNSIIKKMLNDSICECALCKRPLSSDELNELKRLFENGGRSEEKILELTNNISYLEKWENKIEHFKEILSARQKINECKNWKEILSKYNSESENNWKEYKNLQDILRKINENEQNLKIIKELKSNVEDYNNKLLVLNAYIKDTNDNLTNSILQNTTDIITKINSRYKQVVCWENNFYVMVEDENLVLNLLPIQRLSNGEKTIISLAILLSVHKLFVPEIPLLFDEAFSALDRENLSVVKNIIKNHNGQIFVITHDNSWNYFGGENNE